MIELLIVIGILAVLATVTLLVINPAQMFAESRDASRISDMDTINKALLYYQGVGGTSLGLTNKVYISIPSSYTNCSDLSLPALGTGYAYVCSDQAHYRNADGTGWIPVDFTSTQGTLGALLTSLLIDPVNTVANGFYYTDISGSWALSATMESQKYLSEKAPSDGGSVSTRFEVGNEIVLNENLTAPVYALRDTGPAGGLIFYDDEADGIDNVLSYRYLEAAPLSSERSSIIWSDPHASLIGTSVGIGTGRANTVAIVSAISSESDRAAQVCDSLVAGGFSDWFLPSKDELELMYLNLAAQGVGNFANNYYASSSEFDATKIWWRLFTNGAQDSQVKFIGYYVRCVRAF